MECCLKIHWNCCRTFSHTTSPGGYSICWDDSSSGCDPIKRWMREIMKGDHALVDVLRVLFNCVIFGQANYQRYLEAAEQAI